MKVVYNWLKEFVDVTAPPSEVASRRVPHPRFLRVGLRDLTKLGLRQTELS
ncbi:MAG TPA: hypothetical protein VJW94_06140 [Candidatus Acidoferrum sp.]|nr:hypothetical protein [Candidatus Acidoferrum sp.]